MKRLLLLRHAKSSWKEAGLADFDRPLNGRGKRAAESMGRLLKKEKLQPDLVLSSPANRARETIRIVLESARMPVEVRYDQHLYLAGIDTLAEIVSEIEPDRESVMLVGHNPGMEEFLSLLIGATQLMPTGTLANIKLNVTEWNEVSKTTRGHLEWLVKPRTLEG
jgi:phosphohistidine phosphatase